MEINALTAPKAYTTFYDEDIQNDLDTMNEKMTIIKTSDLSDITSDIWDMAGYVEVYVRPVDKDKAPDYAFGHAEFKGTRPEQATFYIQPDGDDAKKALVSRTSLKRIGDGFESNGSRSGAIPMGLGL